MDFTAYIGIAFNYLDYLKLKVAPEMYCTPLTGL